MINPWSEHPWRRVAVYGLGISGRAAVQLLRRQNVEVVAYDDRAADDVDVSDLAEDTGIELRLGGHSDFENGDLATLDGIVTSPGVLWILVRNRTN